MEVVIAIALIIALFLIVGSKNGGSGARAEQRRIDEPPKPLNLPPQKCAGETAPLPKSSQVTPEVVSGPAYVTDGDGLRIKKTELRLFGVDAPEFAHPFGKKAKWALHALCKGQTVRAEIVGTDDHGRKVAKCFLPDGRDLSAEMVKQGLALDWAKYSGGVYRHHEPKDVRKKLWLADARQNGRTYLWEKFEARQKARNVSE